jgi:cyclopropane-fatty-acyl-phospholipid synthase
MSAATEVSPVFTELFGGEPPVRFEFWDASTVGPDDGPGHIAVRSPVAIRRLLYSPDELGFSRAYVSGELEIVGPVSAVLRDLQLALPIPARRGVKAMPKMVSAARALGAWGKPLPAPPEEVVSRGMRHTVSRDKVAVSHHYDVGNEFYALVLGPTMTYSCARFAGPEMTLEAAQNAKHDNICRKLGLDALRSHRLLDVGCGWGSMAMRAAAEFGATVVGITISNEQADEARRRVREAGLQDHVEIRIQDYRDVRDGPYDVISSIGMSEHVGVKRMDEYFATLRSLVGPGGRLLNHAISAPGGSRLDRRGFMNRYVFPDGELLDVGETVLAMERAGFEVRDVESLREHYSRTLAHWVENLEKNWDRAVESVGEARARVWLLYMSGSINNFDNGSISIHQVLGVRPNPDGNSLMSPSRAGWEG